MLDMVKDGRLTRDVYEAEARECRVPFNEELYGRMANRFAADPERYEFHFISLGALLTRV